MVVLDNSVVNVTLPSIRAAILIAVGAAVAAIFLRSPGTIRTAPPIDHDTE